MSIWGGLEGGCLGCLLWAGMGDSEGGDEIEG